MTLRSGVMQRTKSPDYLRFKRVYTLPEQDNFSYSTSLHSIESPEVSPISIPPVPEHLDD
jgi:hypothetical protein